ncbi:MAG: hypothetical protein R3F43_19675 [bacterium]
MLGGVAQQEQALVGIGHDFCTGFRIAQTAPLQARDCPPRLDREAFPSRPQVDVGPSAPFVNRYAEHGFQSFQLGSVSMVEGRVHENPITGSQARYLHPYIYTSPVGMPDPTNGPLPEWDAPAVPAATDAIVQAFLDEVSHHQIPYVPPVISDISGVLTALSPNPDINPDNEWFSSTYIRQGWIDGGRLHGSGTFDYANRQIETFQQDVLPPAAPFPVHAIADGVVLFSAFNASMGNVLVIRHEDDGRPVHALYHHLANGALNDYENARRTVRACGSAGASAVCPALSDRFTMDVNGAEQTLALGGELNPTRWGTAATRLFVAEGAVVHRGQLIGYAGRTGVDQSGIHLHFGMASPSPIGDTAQGRFWWGFDPYGLYGGPACYAGLYPSGRPGVGRQHRSIFAPLMADHATAPIGIQGLAAQYYERLGWTSVTISVVGEPCAGEGYALAGSYQPGNPRRARAGMSFEELRTDTDALLAFGWLPRSISAADTHRGLVYAAVWEASRGGEPMVLYGAPAGPQLRRWLVERVRNLADRRIVDICPYSESGRLRCIVVLDRALVPNAGFDFRFGIEPAALLAAVQDVTTTGRLITRLHHHREGRDIRYLIVSRRRLPSESFDFVHAQRRKPFVTRSARRRQEGRLLEYLDVVENAAGGIYHAGYIRNTLPSFQP